MGGVSANDIEGATSQDVNGAGELELVRSGLDDTMRTAYGAMREIWHGGNDVTDLRVAAYIVAIDRRVAKSYRSKVSDRRRARLEK